MDVLFESIDVRDLLSTADASATSPLSAPDLRLLISRLTVRSNLIRSNVESYLVSHRHDFSLLFSSASRSLSSLSLLHRSLSLLLDSLSLSPDSDIRHVADEIKAKMGQLREKKEMLVLVKGVLGFSERLGIVRRDLEEGRVVEAAVTVKEMETELGGGDVAEREGEPVVFGLLRKEWARCFDQIQDVLVRFMETAVHLEQQHKAIHVKYFSDGVIHGIELHTVLEAMDVIGILGYGLVKAADMIVKFAITPVVTCKSSFTFVEEIKQEDGRDVEAILKLISSPDHEIELDVGSIYSELIKVVQFIYGSICWRRSDWMQSFGRLTWPRMSELIIKNILSKVVPDDASKIVDFQRVVTLTSEFETSLKEIHFISASDSSDARLSEFTDNVEVHFASRKKVEILAKARNLLLHSDFALPQEQTRRAGSKNQDVFQRFPHHVVELLFLPESCVVSKAALQLMELVHQTLKDVCLSSTRVALEFYNAARDALLLYEAIIPVKQERQLDGINQVAVLIHNDCLYLSQEILALAFEVKDRIQNELNDLEDKQSLTQQYRPDFPDPVKELAVFADMAPRFQLMAEQLLHRQIQLVIHNLKEAVDGANGFQNTHQMQQFESAKFSIDQVVFILEKVHIIWEPLLIPSTYKRSMCTVLDPVFFRMANDILQLDDMAAEETLQLQRLIQLMLEGLSSLLDSLTTNTEMGKSKENLTRSIDDLIPSLRKIRKLADLLDMPLKSITETWESGELVSCGFTLAEVQDFIRAIFADSPLRKECLRRIVSTWF